MHRYYQVSFFDIYQSTITGYSQNKAVELQGSWTTLGLYVVFTLGPVWYHDFGTFISMLGSFLVLSTVCYSFQEIKSCS